MRVTFSPGRAAPAGTGRPLIAGGRDDMVTGAGVRDGADAARSSRWRRRWRWRPAIRLVVLAAGTDGTDGARRRRGRAGRRWHRRARSRRRSRPGAGLDDNDAHGFLAAARDPTSPGPRTRICSTSTWSCAPRSPMATVFSHAVAGLARARRSSGAPGASDGAGGGGRNCTLAPDLDVVGLWLGVPVGPRAGPPGSHPLAGLRRCARRGRGAHPAVFSRSRPAAGRRALCGLALFVPRHGLARRARRDDRRGLRVVAFFRAVRQRPPLLPRGAATCRSRRSASAASSRGAASTSSRPGLSS